MFTSHSINAQTEAPGFLRDASGACQGKEENESSLKCCHRRQDKLMWIVDLHLF